MNTRAFEHGTDVAYQEFIHKERHINRVKSTFLEILLGADMPITQHNVFF